MVTLHTVGKPSLIVALACAGLGWAVSCGGSMESASPSSAVGGTCCGGSAASSGAASAAEMGGTGGASNTEPQPNSLGGAASRIVFATTVPYGRPLNHGLLTEVTRTDHAVVAAPAIPESTEDSGARLRWYSPSSELWLERLYPQAIVPEAIAVGPDDCIWMAGPVYRDLDFGAGLIAEVEEGYYVAKLTATGEPLFGFAVATTASTWVHAIAVDPLGNAYLTGALNEIVASSVRERLFLAKYSPEGKQIYVQEFPGSASTATPSDVAVAANGDVLIAGYFNGSLDFGSQKLDADPEAGANDSGFVVALDAARGAPRWARKIGGSALAWVASVDVTAWGALRIAGQLSGPAHVGDTNVAAAMEGSPFVAELTSDGNTTWVEVLEGFGAVRDADTDSSGRTYAVGTVDGTSSFPMNHAVSFLVDVTRGGTHPILHVTSNANGGWGIAADHRGGVWVIGNFAGRVDFGNVVLTAPTDGIGAWYLLHLEPERAR